MPVKYTTVKAQVLIVAALFTWISASAVAPTPHSYALDSMNVTRALLSNKRSLRSNADMTLSTLADEERAPPVSPHLIDAFQNKYQTQVEKDFDKYGFNLETIDFLNTQKFGAWVSQVLEHNKSLPQKVYMASIYRALRNKGFKGTYEDIIVAETQRRRVNMFFNYLIEAEFEKWHGKSVREVLNLLKLDNVEKIDFFSQNLALTWVSFVRKRYGASSDARKTTLATLAMLDTLREIYKGDDLIRVAALGTKVIGVVTDSKRMVDILIEERINKTKDVSGLFSLFNLQTTTNPFIEDLYTKWVNYVFKVRSKIAQEKDLSLKQDDLICWSLNQNYDYQKMDEVIEKGRARFGDPFADNLEKFRDKTKVLPNNYLEAMKDESATASF